MLPLAHIYVSTEVTGRKTSLLTFGSILPDIATTSKGEIDRDKIHYAPKEFYQFVSKNFPELLDLAVGVRLHSNVDKGADFYSDDTETGYAKVNGREISQDVANMLGIEDESISLVLAHNFIEMGIDLNLRDSNPNVLALYKKSLAEVALPSIATCLACYLSKNKSEIKKELNNFTSFLSPNNFMSLKAIVNNVALPLIAIRFQKLVDPNLALAIGQKSIDITKPTYTQFLDKTIQQLKLNFPEFVYT